MLQSLDPDKAQPFFTAELNKPESLLTARNQSILAHGFIAVSDQVSKQLLADALNLLPATESELPVISIPG